MRRRRGWPRFGLRSARWTDDRRCGCPALPAAPVPQARARRRPHGGVSVFSASARRSMAPAEGGSRRRAGREQCGRRTVRLTVMTVSAGGGTPVRMRAESWRSRTGVGDGRREPEVDGGYRRSGRREPEAEGGCRRLRAGAGDGRRVPDVGGECRRLMASAGDQGECRRLTAGTGDGRRVPER